MPGGYFYMTDVEWAARRERIKQANNASNNRVREFIELVAGLCAERTARRKRPNASAPPSPVLVRTYESEEDVRGGAEESSGCP